MRWTRGVEAPWLILSSIIGAGAGLVAGWGAMFPATVVFASLLFAVLGVLFIIDARTTYLPDPWMIIAGVLVLAHPLAVSATTDLVAGLLLLMLALVGASIGFCFFMTTRILTGQLGLGDVKLAAVLGGWLLPLGWSALGTGFIIAALAGAAWMGVSLARGRSTAAYGPAMIAGAILATGLS